MDIRHIYACDIQVFLIEAKEILLVHVNHNLTQVKTIHQNNKKKILCTHITLLLAGM